MKTFLIVFSTYIMGISFIGYALPKMLDRDSVNNPFKYSHVLINN